MTTFGVDEADSAKGMSLALRLETLDTHCRRKHILKKTL